MAAPSSGTAAPVLSLGGWQMGVAETLVLHTSGLPRAHTKGPELQERCRAEQGRRPPLSVGQQPHQARRLLSISPTVCGFPSAAPVAGFLGPSRSQLRFIREPVSHRRTEPAHDVEYLLWCCLLPPLDPEVHGGKRPCLFLLAVYPQHTALCLAHSRSLGNVF